MKAAALALALLALAGCASKSTEPSADTGTIIGEVGEPRNRARVHTELGALYYTRGNLAVALEELRIAMAADAGYAPAYGMLGLVYLEMRENDRAEESFQQGLRLAPGDADINHNYGLFLCRTGREAESIKYFMLAVRNPLYSAPWRSYSAAGLCSMRTKNVKDAEEYFQRALKMEPDEPGSLLQLGQIRYNQGNMVAARQLVSRYNKVVEPTAESLWLALRIERRLGERVAEQSYANQLRRRFPGSPEFQALQRGKFD